ncbi:hypothetical protein FDP41_011810 [Naegleria fowleri]|uniref:Uncharacterized protein n=1 Tax=Naegleria fowleri TaxID=5763 RepID=A0A6A5C9L5_NAEFO|nr:uncharacterized protein FDP41_011810 [Naegleria fowleri]KAF0981949.1 hypothetical protein FDP41_011810 [Naegleria fowleri]CAG4708064.1 unnamed protein product [Naegleria fowleri]
MPTLQHSCRPPEEYCTLEIVASFKAYSSEGSMDVQKKKDIKTKIQKELQRLKEQKSLNLGSKFKPSPTYRKGFSLFIQTMKPLTSLNEVLNDDLFSRILNFMKNIKQIGDARFCLSKIPVAQGTDDPQLSGEILSTTSRNASLYSFHSTFFPIMSSPEELTNVRSPPEDVTTIKWYDQEIKELRQENKYLEVFRQEIKELR